MSTGKNLRLKNNGQVDIAFHMWFESAEKHIWCTGRAMIGFPCSVLVGVWLESEDNSLLGLRAEFWAKCIHCAQAERALLVGHEAGGADPSPDTAAIKRPTRPAPCSAPRSALPASTAIAARGDLAGSLHVPAQRRFRGVARAATTSFEV